MNKLPLQASASYDAAGDLTGDGGSYSYHYDAEGRLVSINGGSVATLGYNALGQQVQMSTPSTTWSVLFDPTGGWAGRNTSGNWEVGGVFHLGQRQFGMYLDQFYGIHVNALGSTAADTNAAGSEAGAFLFYPWGQTWNSGSGPWQFSAFEYGDPPYLFPTLFRTYYPEFGRWLTPDSTGGDITNPQSLNRYAYVLNNPATLTDPLGLQPGDDPGYGGVDCRSWQYAESHAECQGPGSPWCFESTITGAPCPTGTLGFPVGGGGYGGGGGGSASSAPPAGRPPIGGNSLLHQYPCLSTGQLEELESELLATAGTALGGLTLNGPGGPVIGGAQNVVVGVRGGPPVVYVNPSVVAQAGTADPLEQVRGWKKQLIVPDTHLPGPGNVVHILFNPGQANAQGQIGITAIDIHADIAGQQDVASGSHHLGSDVFWAWWSSLRQNGCAVKLF